MKKYVAILLALLVLCMFGCTTTVETGETTAETTDTVPVLLTAEDYFLKAFEVDVARSMEMAETYKSARMSLGVKNVDYLLSLFAMNNAGLPAISDVALEIAADSEKLDAMYLLSAMINGHDANIGLNINMTDFDMTVFSNLFEDVIGIDYSEMVGMEMPDMSSIYELSYRLTEEVALLSAELLIEHNSGIELVDNGDTVTVTVTVDCENAFEIGKALINELANDEQFVKFMSDVYQVDFAEDIKRPLDESEADVKAEFEELGISVKMGVEIDKETFYPHHVDAEFEIDETVIAVSVNENEDASEADITIEVADIFTVNVEYTDSTFDLSLNGASEDTEVNATLAAEDGLVDFAMNIAALEYDWNNGGYVSVEHEIAADGTYSADDTSFMFTLGKVVYNDIEIDLSKAGITLGYAYNCEVPTTPEVTKNFLDITDEEGQALIMGIFEKLEIDPAMFGIGAAVPETEMDYDAYYEESYEVQ